MKTLLDRFIAKIKLEINIGNIYPNNSLFDIGNDNLVLYTDSQPQGPFIQVRGKYHHFKRGDDITNVVKSYKDADTYHNNNSGADISIVDYDILIELDPSLAKIYSRNRIVDRTVVPLDYDSYDIHKLYINPIAYIDNYKDELVLFNPFEFMKTKMAGFRTKNMELIVAEGESLFTIRTLYNHNVTYNALNFILKNYPPEGKRYIVPLDDIELLETRLHNAMHDVYDRCKGLISGDITLRYDDVTSFFGDVYIDEYTDKGRLFDDFAAQYISDALFINILNDYEVFK